MFLNSDAPLWNLQFNILFKSRFEPFYIAAIRCVQRMNSEDASLYYYLYCFARIFVLLADADDSVSTFQVSDLREFVSILYVLFIKGDDNILQKNLNDPN